MALQSLALTYVLLLFFTGLGCICGDFKSVRLFCDLEIDSCTFIEPRQRDKEKSKSISIKG
jgi:hypothetical protein